MLSASAQRVEGLKAVDQEVANLVATLRRSEGAGADLHHLRLGQRLHARPASTADGQRRLSTIPATRIPLIIRGPGFKPNTTYNGVVGLHDLAPTILTMTRQQGDQRVVPMDGISLYNLATGCAAHVQPSGPDRTATRINPGSLAVAWLCDCIQLEVHLPPRHRREWSCTTSTSTRTS